MKVLDRNQFRKSEHQHVMNYVKYGKSLNVVSSIDDAGHTK
ncbi:hypothetical protein IFVP69_C190004 [Vibrio parahaemolyticus]